MRTYYAVITNCYDDGRVTAELIDIIETDMKPESMYKQTQRCDIYIDWYKNKQEALKVVEQTRMT